MSYFQIKLKQIRMWCWLKPILSLHKRKQTPRVEKGYKKIKKLKCTNTNSLAKSIANSVCKALVIISKYPVNYKSIKNINSRCHFESRNASMNEILKEIKKPNSQKNVQSTDIFVQILKRMQTHFLTMLLVSSMNK